MEYTIFLIGLTLILIPLVISCLGSLLFYLYVYLTNTHKMVFKESSFISLSNLKTKILFDKEKKRNWNIILFVYLGLTILLSYLISNWFFIFVFQFEIDIILVLFSLIIPFIFVGISYKSKEISSISVNLFKNIMTYYIPLILSILSIIIALYGISGNIENLSIINVINFQNSGQFRLYGIPFPRYFLFLNPFAAAAYFTSLLGIFRIYKSGLYGSIDLNQKLFSKLFRNMSFLTLISLFISIFLGGGKFFDQILMNLPVIIIISLTFLVILSLIDGDKPKLFIERNLWNSLNIPMILSIISVLYSLFLIYFII